MALWKLNPAYLLFLIFKAENRASTLPGRLYGYTLKWSAPIRKSMWLKPGVYFHLDSHSCISTWQLPPSSFQKKYHSKKPFCRQRRRLFRRHKSTRIVCRFRRTATAPKRSTKNVCHDSRVTKSVLFFRFVSETSSLWLQDSRTITFKWTIKSYCMWLNLE